MNQDGAFPGALPPDPDGPVRRRLWQERGMALRPVKELDQYAHDLRVETGTKAAFLNLVDDRFQFFVGMNAAPATQPGGVPAPEPAANDRRWDRSAGFCPHVIAKGSALPLRDTRASRRYGAGNSVVREHGFLAYLGVPLRAPQGVPEAGTIIGTMCVVDGAPNNWTEDDVEFLKTRGAAAVDLMYSLAPWSS